MIGFDCTAIRPGSLQNIVTGSKITTLTLIMSVVFGFEFYLNLKI